MKGQNGLSNGLVQHASPRWWRRAPRTLRSRQARISPAVKRPPSRTRRPACHAIAASVVRSLCSDADSSSASAAVDDKARRNNSGSSTLLLTLLAGAVSLFPRDVERAELANRNARIAEACEQPLALPLVCPGKRHQVLRLTVLALPAQEGRLSEGDEAVLITCSISSEPSRKNLGVTCGPERWKSCPACGHRRGRSVTSSRR